MIYVFDKSKIFSYVIACCFVLSLFFFKEKLFPNNDVELVKVSSNVINDINEVKNINIIENNY